MMRFGEFRLDIERSRLLRGTEPVVIPPRALDMLIALVRHRDRIVGKSELLDLVWPDTHVEEANLTQQVFTLRRILGDDPGRPRFIATLPRRGYRFVGELVEEPSGIEVPGGPPPANGNGHGGPLPGVPEPSIPVVGQDGAGLRREGEVPRRAWVPPYLAWAGTGATVIVLVSVFLLRPLGSPPTAGGLPVTFDLTLPAGTTLAYERHFAGVSPNGEWLAVVARPRGGVPTLYARRLGDVAMTAIPGTDGASYPFWSPDSRRLGFFADGKLRTVSVERGGPLDVCSAPDPRGGSCGADDVILFSSSSRSALSRVPAAGGEPAAATHLEGARRDISHRFPVFLPDGRRFLYLAWSGDVERQGIYAGEIGRSEVRRISPEPSPPGWSNGRLLFVHQEALVAQPFDEQTLTPSGDVVTITSPVARDPSDAAWFAAGASNALAVVRSRFESRLLWMDRAGSVLAQVWEAGQFDSPEISPDGTRVLVAVRNRAAGVENMDIWTSDVDGRNRSRITFEPAVDVEPVWSPDGREVIFRSNRLGTSDIYRKRLDSSTSETLLLRSPQRKDVNDWSRNGRLIAFAVERDKADIDIDVIAADGHEPPRPLVALPGDQRNVRFSPDGRFIVYESNENGELELFVEGLQSWQGRRWRVGRGRQPAWRADGRELFFVDNRGIAVVGVTWGSGGPTFSAPQGLFDVALHPTLRNAFTVWPDGQRFLVVRLEPQDEPPVLTVLLNWVAGLGK